MQQSKAPAQDRTEDRTEHRTGDREARRRFLKSMGAAALAPLLPAAGLAAAPALAGAPGLAAPQVTPLGRMFLVNGWVLTRADLEALGLPC